jgi:hypothetical protein
MQTPIGEITWPEIPASVYATQSSAGLRLLGLTAKATLHVIDVTAGERGLEKDWASVSGALGQTARFVPDIKPGGQDTRREEVGSIAVTTRRGDKDWRIMRLGMPA